MLIIEGPDAVGKTTLARKCVKAANDLFEQNANLTPATYVHLSALPHGWHYYQDYLPLIQRGFVMDRFHLSEVAYGKGIRKDTNLSNTYLDMLNAQITLIGGVTALLVPKSEDLFRKLFTASMTKREEMFTDIDAMCRVYREYYNMYENNDMFGIHVMWVMRGEEDYPPDSFAENLAAGWSSKRLQAYMASKPRL